MMTKRWSAVLALVLVAVAAGLASAGVASAAVPQPWQLGFQPAASPVMQEVVWFHDMLLVIITAITIFVLALLIYVCLRYSEKANPKPANFSHNTLIEIAWTVVPVIILVVIAIPSFRLLYYMDRGERPEMTVKVVAHQWYWAYEYPDHGGFTFNANMIPENELKPGQIRLLDTDARLVVPVGTPIRVQIASADVMHVFQVPAFGVSKYATPGRLNETWFRADAEGVYYGQCLQICGINHGFMPIAVEVVSKEAYAAWVERAKGGDVLSPKLAEAQAADERKTAALAVPATANN